MLSTFYVAGINGNVANVVILGVVGFVHIGKWVDSYGCSCSYGLGALRHLSANPPKITNSMVFIMKIERVQSVLVVTI